MQSLESLNMCIPGEIQLNLKSKIWNLNTFNKKRHIHIAYLILARFDDVIIGIVQTTELWDETSLCRTATLELKAT